MEKLHYTISNAFGFDGREIASFYRTDDQWNQGEEIPLFNMSEIGEGLSMSTCLLNTTLPRQNDKLIYVYDFLKMWTFYVEVIEISNETITEPKIILSVGEIPKNAPNKEFKAENINKQFDEYDEYEHFDDFDFDNY